MTTASLQIPGSAAATKSKISLSQAGTERASTAMRVSADWTSNRHGIRSAAAVVGLPPTFHLPAASQQFRCSQVVAHSFAHRHAHAKVAPEWEEGDSKDQKKQKGRKGRRDSRRSSRKHAPTSSRLSRPQQPSHTPETSKKVDLLHTSQSETEHMAQSRPSTQPAPAVADEKQHKTLPRTKGKPGPSRGGDKRQDAATTSASAQQRPSTPKPSPAKPQSLDHSDQSLGQQEELPSQSTQQPPLFQRVSEWVDKGIATLKRAWRQIRSDRLWHPVVPGELSAATPSQQLQEAQFENVWQEDGAACIAHSSASPLQELHGIATGCLRKAQSIHSLPDGTLSLLDRCIAHVETTWDLSDGCVLQVVRDATVHTQAFRELKASKYRDSALNKLKTLIDLVVCKSLRQKLSCDPEVKTSGPLAVPSRDLVHCLALSFALAECGVTSEEYVQAAANLMHRELQHIAATPAAPLSLVAATSVMQALPYCGSNKHDEPSQKDDPLYMLVQRLKHKLSHRHAQSVRRLTAQLCRSSSVPAALSALEQNPGGHAPLLTGWDWVKFYVPHLGFVGGFHAAACAPAPVLHMHGLHARVEGDKTMPQFSLPRPIQTIEPDKAGTKQQPAVWSGGSVVPWRAYAAWGQRNPVDTLVLLLHSFLVAHLRQTGLSRQIGLSTQIGRSNHELPLDPEAFSKKYLAAFDSDDKRFVHSIYSALNTLSQGNQGVTSTNFPEKLLIADCISQKVGLVSGTARSVSDNQTPSTRDSMWRAIIHSFSERRRHRQPGVAEIKELTRRLRRFSADQPGLQDRLFTTEHFAHAVKILVRSLFHGTLSVSDFGHHMRCISAIPGLRDELLAFEHGDTEFLYWLTDTFSEDVSLANIFLLRSALMAESVRQSTWLQSVPDSVFNISSCLSSPNFKRHNASLTRAVSHLFNPGDPCNEQVAQALRNAVIRAPQDELLPLFDSVQMLVMMTQIVQPLKQLQASPTQADEALQQLRQVAALTNPMSTVHSKNVSSAAQLKCLEARVCRKVKLSVSQFCRMRIIVDRAISRAGHAQWDAGHGSASSLSCGRGNSWGLLQDVKELYMKAGCGEAVRGCRVTAELANHRTHSLDSTDSDHIGLPEGLQQYCNSRLTKMHGHPSEMQKTVHMVLQKLKYPVLSERRLAGVPFSVDVLTRGQDKSGVDHHVVLEVDGPTHFLHSPDSEDAPELSPADHLKVACLLLHRVLTIRVSYEDWDRVGVSGKGIHHGENQVSWLENELERRGIVRPGSFTQDELFRFDAG